ncbi:hypothetical protein LOTGIDRAFT_161149 [Lottia gigantea]|uniref:BRCT domain-containing protein n=1 Tax=Lottia gigantea TaxID=225164 RepID=V4ACA7_LOTGI|nr:hypothetical protein LOTGIDRAFT_161149 [Lottia gigantea]ESO94457.1 hypothetical protein LOTGIDRAFT_161149 [Lottia gigantea]
MVELGILSVERWTTCKSGLFLAMDSSDDDSEDVPTAFMVGTSQVETQTNQDTKTILQNLPALTKSSKTSESDSAKEKSILFTNRLLETSSEDEVKKQEMAKVLVKDSESEMEQIKHVSETNDEKDSFSDEDIVMTQSASDANITVICKTKFTAGKNTDEASTSGVTSSPVVIANTFQSQGFDLAPSSQEDMFFVKDTCDDEEITPIKSSQNFRSLQLSGEPMIVPETLDQNLGDSPEIIMSTPRIIPNSPTDDSLLEDNDKKEETYDPTAIATLNDQVKESVNTGNESKPADSQDLALRLSPSQPYPYNESPCQSLRYEEEINIDDTGKKTTNSSLAESFHLSIPREGVLLHPTITDSKHGTSTDNSTSPDTNKTSPSQEGGLDKQASLDIDHICTETENNSDTSFHLNVPQVLEGDNICDDTNQQNVFNLAKTGSKRPKHVSTFIEESSEDVFAFEKRRKITKDDDNERENASEPIVVEEQESVDPNAETQPSNDDCSSVTGEKQSVVETEDTQLYKPDNKAKQSTSVEIIEADEVGNLIKKPSVIVLDSEETETEHRDNTTYTSLLEKKIPSDDKMSKAAEEMTDVVQPIDKDIPPDQNIQRASQCSEEIPQSQSLNKMNEESKDQSGSLGSQSKPAQSSQNNQSLLLKSDSETKQSSQVKPSRTKECSQQQLSVQLKPKSQAKAGTETVQTSQPKSDSQQNPNQQIQASSVLTEGRQVDKDSTPKQTVESEHVPSASSQPKQSLNTGQESILKQPCTKQNSQNKSAELEKATSSRQLEKEVSVEDHVHFQIDDQKLSQDASEAAPKAQEDETADPYLFLGTQSQGLLGTTVSVTTSATHPDQSTKQTSKSPKAISGKKLKKLPAKRILPKKTQIITETRSSTDDQQIGLSRHTTLRRKRTSSKKQSKASDEFVRPEEPVTTPLRSRTEARSSHETPSSVQLQHGESSRPQSQRKMDFQEFAEALQKSSSSSISSQEELEYHEVTTKYKVVDITITNKRGDVLYNKTKKEREEPIVVKRKISKEEVHQFESPRSLSTLSSGELGDIESLSRSSGSKNSLPQSLDKTSPSLDVLSPSLQKSKSDSSQTTHIAASSLHSDIANTPNESPIGNEEMGAHTGGVEISDVIFTSPETSDTAKKHSEVPRTTKSTSPLVRKQAADSSSQDTSEIECAQRQTTTTKVPDDPGLDESGGFSVRGGTASVHSSSSGRKEDISTTPTGRSSKKKTGTGRGKQSVKSRSKNTTSTSTTTTTTTDTSKTSPEIPMIGGNKDTSTTTMSTKPTYASKLTEGSAVMAKWKDGYYYPGTIKQIDSERVMVSFDDGDVKYVKNSNILLVKQLPIGQSVMVLSNDGYFDTGMILGHLTSDSDESFLYQVEKDNGEKQRYSHSQVILSEDQAACLMSDEELRISQPGGSHVSTHINPANVSLDNLVEGKRTRSAKKDSKKEMREPSETKRLGRKRKAREGGPMATSTPTPKGKRLQTEKAHQSSSTTSNLLDSPSTSGTRHSPRKVRVGLFDDSTKTFGLFKEMAFLLTHGVKTKEQKREEKKQLRDSDISTEESSAEEEELHPFNKHQLISLIVEGRGVILNEYDQEKINQYKCCYLISDSHHRTVKYMQALAAGLPCVSHLWIIFSSSQGRLLDYKSYILPAGINIEKRKLCEWNSRGSCLSGLNVMVNSSNKEFVSAWSSVLNISRCHLITKLPTAKSKTKLDVIITDNSCSSTVLKKAEQLSIPIVSTEWVIQCLITSHIVNYAGNPKYRHDYYDK